MDPNNFSNPNSANEGISMFGGDGGARWPGHENYRIETPGSVGSTYCSKSEFDPFFYTDSYRVEEMDPSCGQPSALVPTQKKKTARKDKVPSVPLPSNDPNNECPIGRTDYTPEKYLKVVECWLDISEDSIMPTTRR